MILSSKEVDIVTSKTFEQLLNNLSFMAERNDTIIFPSVADFEERMECYGRLMEEIQVYSVVYSEVSGSHQRISRLIDVATSKYRMVVEARNASKSHEELSRLEDGVGDAEGSVYGKSKSKEEIHGPYLVPFRAFSPPRAAVAPSNSLLGMHLHEMSLCQKRKFDGCGSDRTAE